MGNRVIFGATGRSGDQDHRRLRVRIDAARVSTLRTGQPP
jgi:hypothetical protein